MKWLGLDIGGANIKAALSDGKVSSTPFRFWVEHQRLKESLVEIINSFAAGELIRVAATMTAELADCFESRRTGVAYVVDCLDAACEDLGLAQPVYAGTDLEFRLGPDAKKHWLETAASNWAMMAAFASRFLPVESGLVVDMGSTTTDIIPVRDGKVITKGKTDSQRLQHGELVYVGAKRTPICSVLQEFILDGESMPIARELFATVDDAMILCGFATEDDQDCDTADGRPRTKVCAAQRICRMICEDSETMEPDNILLMATQTLQSVEDLVVLKIVDPVDILCAGSGVDFLVHVIEKHFPNAKVQTLGARVNESVNQAAPAYSVASLALEKIES